GFVLTAGVAGALLEPFSLPRMVAVSAGVVGMAWLVATLAVWGVEGDAPAVPEPETMPAFRLALREVWAETRARRLTVFIFVSMLAYSAQDLILEPFAGSIFGLTPGQSTQLSGIQNSGVLLGMLLVAGLARSGAGRGLGSLTAWCVGGCLASGLALFGLAVAGYLPDSWPLAPSVFALGAANGAFSVAAIGSMMAMVAEGARAREGVRMGLWGAAQAIAFAAGGIAGTGLVDLIRWASGSVLTAYSTVFFLEGLVFLVAAYLARHIGPASVVAQARTWPGRGAVTVSAGGR
ncbi:MAG: PucC family protein, partial [Candidatus Sericytochromatia bacterium]|nr:PucC family protein [Candidatus Sericytochromatia bacterium]